MANVFSSYTDATVSEPAHRVASIRPVLPSKRPLSEVNYSSYGESELTPTPKQRKEPRPYSNAGSTFHASSPAMYSTSPLAQTPRDSVMEDSGDESDELYDQFDLGDFTKEEIKNYESMVPPGERLRHAAPPEKSLAEMLEASYQSSLASSGQAIERPASVGKLPEELYELVRAGIANAIEHAISESWIQEEDPLVYDLKKILMDEISGPFPQISHFIRNHGFPWCCSVRGSIGKAPRWLQSGSIESAQRQYEQDVYDFSRYSGLSMDDAEKWVFKAREFCSEKDYDGVDFEEADDVSNWNKTLDQATNVLSPEMFNLPLEPAEHSDQAPGDSTSGRFHANSSPEPRHRSAYCVSQALTSACKSNFEGKGVFEDKIRLTTKAAKKMAKATRKARARAEREATRRVEKGQQQKEEDERIASPERQVKTTTDLEAASQFELPENKDKPPRQKKRGRKRKSEVFPLSEVQPGGNHQHIESKVDSDAQGSYSWKSKTRKRGLHYSPFFHRSRVTGAEKDVNKVATRLGDLENNGYRADTTMDKAKTLVGFPTPMIQQA